MWPVGRKVGRLGGPHGTPKIKYILTNCYLFTNLDREWAEFSAHSQSTSINSMMLNIRENLPQLTGVWSCQVDCGSSCCLADIWSAAGGTHCEWITCARSWEMSESPASFGWVKCWGDSVLICVWLVCAVCFAGVDCGAGKWGRSRCPYGMRLASENGQTEARLTAWTKEIQNIKIFILNIQYREKCIDKISQRELVGG